MLGNSPVSAVLPAVDINRAKQFYTNKLGLKIIFSGTGFLMLKAGKGTSLVLYKRKRTKAEHTVAGFEVGNIEKVVASLKKKDVKFEEYDMGEIKTVDGIATMGSSKSAWFGKSPFLFKTHLILFF